MLARNRQLDEEDKALISETAKMKGSKLLLMKKMYEDGKQPILRDISNIISKSRIQVLDSLPEIERILNANGTLQLFVLQIK